MESLSVVMSFKSMLINTIFLVFIPVAMAIGGELLFTKSVSWIGLLISALLFICLQGFLIYQGLSGKVSLKDGELRVSSGFYTSSWPSSGFQVISEEQANLADSIRVNGIAMYGYKTGWFRVAARDIFLLSTTDDRLCLSRDGKAVVCMDRWVVEHLSLVLEKDSGKSE